MERSIPEHNAGKTTDDLVDPIGLTVEEVKGRLRSVNERVTTFVQEHPVACVAGAVALGYLVARLARRERS